MTDDTISSRVKQRLDELGMSMKEASRLAGLGETAVRDLVSREGHSPRTRTLEALAPVLETTVIWLMTGRGEGEQDPSIAQIVDLWDRKLDDEARKEVLDFAKWKAAQSD